MSGGGCGRGGGWGGGHTAWFLVNWAAPDVRPRNFKPTAGATLPNVDSNGTRTSQLEGRAPAFEGPSEPWGVGIPRTDAVGGPGAGGGRSDKGRHEKAGRPAGGLACAPAARGLAQLRAEWLGVGGGVQWRLVEPHGKWGQCQDWSAGSLTQSPALGSVSHSLGCVAGGLDSG